MPVAYRWNALYQMLPRESDSEGRRQPELPLILAAIGEPAIFKMMRLREHLEWAEEKKVLDKVAKFVRSLPENEWEHL